MQIFTFKDMTMNAIIQLAPLRSIVAYSFICILLVTIGGCATLKDTFDFTQEEVDLEYPAKDLIIKGMEDYSVGKYFTAAEYFQEITEKYPFSPEALLAELKAADSNYYMERYIEALLKYEDFEDRHPTNEAMPYVIYQQAMCNYKQIDRVDRDPIVAQKALNQFTRLLRTFPESPYTPASREHITEARTFLADHEYSVIEFYLRVEKYDEAKSRIQYLITRYPEAQVSAQAKDILAQIESGEPPRRPVFSWLPDFDLPEWGEAAKDEENTVNPKPNI